MRNLPKKRTGKHHILPSVHAKIDYSAKVTHTHIQQAGQVKGRPVDFLVCKFALCVFFRDSGVIVSASGPERLSSANKHSSYRLQRPQHIDPVHQFYLLKHTHKHTMCEYISRSR